MQRSQGLEVQGRLAARNCGGPNVCALGSNTLSINGLLCSSTPTPPHPFFSPSRTFLHLSHTVPVTAVTAGPCTFQQTCGTAPSPRRFYGAAAFPLWHQRAGSCSKGGSPSAWHSPASAARGAIWRRLAEQLIVESLTAEAAKLLKAPA